MAHNIRIARSGVQYYMYDELPCLGLSSVPREFKELRVFGVYRPASVLASAKDKFVNAPVVIGHEHWVTGRNDPYVVGELGDKVQLKMLKGEAVLKSTLEFDDEDAHYEYVELSPGYTATNRWQDGVSPDGEPFQIVCSSIDTVNHVALVPAARGGEDMKILDGGSKMKIHSGLLRFLHKKSKGQADADNVDTFADLIQEFKAQLGTMSVAEAEQRTRNLLTLVQDFPDSEEKDKLQRFIADMPILQNEDEGSALYALTTILELYRALDRDAISDIMEEPVMSKPKEDQAVSADDSVDKVPTEEKEQTSTEENKVVDASPEGGKEPPSDKTEDESAPEESSEACDCDTTSQPPCTSEIPGTDINTRILDVLTRLEAKMELMMPRTCDAAPSETEKTVNAEETVPRQGDQMPMYTQTMDTINTANSLDAWFASIKEHK